MQRLFAGLSIPDHIAQKLLLLQTNLPKARWRPRENFHITLKFYGEVEHDTAVRLHEALSAIRFEEFEVSLKGAGWFGGKKPQSVWVGVAPSEPLNKLHLASSKAARIAGLSLEQQRYTPHVTLAYCRTTPIEPVASWVTPLTDLVTEPFAMESFHLYSSRIGKGPSIYSIEETFLGYTQ